MYFSGVIPVFSLDSGLSLGVIPVFSLDSGISLEVIPVLMVMTDICLIQPAAGQIASG